MRTWYLQYSCVTLLPDGELEGVDLAEPLLVGQGGDVLAETLEGVVDALHPPPLPHVGRVSHLHLAPEDDQKILSIFLLSLTLWTRCFLLIFLVFVSPSLAESGSV